MKRELRVISEMIEEVGSYIIAFCHILINKIFHLKRVRIFKLLKNDLKCNFNKKKCLVIGANSLLANI